MLRTIVCSATDSYPVHGIKNLSQKCRFVVRFPLRTGLFEAKCSKIKFFILD